MSRGTFGAQPNRWLIAAASCLMQAALGSVYASSVFRAAVMERYGASEREASLAFAITILALGITAGFGGALQRRLGPRLTGTLGGLLYGAGVFLAALAPNLTLFYVTQGVIAGIGLGLGYIVPLAMLIGWFPDKRGLITGLAVAGFGAGAAIVGPLAAAMLRQDGLSATLMILGAGYLAVGVGAAQLFRAAPEGYAPRGWTPPDRSANALARRDFTLGEALNTPRWYLLWLVLALNVSAGAALISVASPLTCQFTGVPPGTAALAVMMIALANGAGRIFWGWTSDRIGRPLAFISLFLVQSLAFCLLARVGDFALLLVLAGTVGLCFGGGFAVMPAFAADFFGAKNAGAIYGAMLTAWSAGCIAGPLLIASMDYRAAAAVIAGAMLAGVPLTLSVLVTRRAGVRLPLAALFGEPLAAGDD
jgi:OFA family oxalate/formate antiporter-like MFS transporter